MYGQYTVDDHSNLAMLHDLSSNSVEMHPIARDGLPLDYIDIPRGERITP